MGLTKHEIETHRAMKEASLAIEGSINTILAMCEKMQFLIQRDRDGQVTALDYIGEDRFIDIARLKDIRKQFLDTDVKTRDMRQDIRRKYTL